MENQKQHIVMFPFMAQGHIIPFLALALKLEQLSTYQITVINTPLNIKNLKSTLPSTSTIHLQEIPFNPSDHHLPPDGENTDSLSSNLAIRLFEAAASLEPGFRRILADMIGNGAPPVCVVADMLLGWSAEVSHEFGIFHAIFSSSGGFGLACYYSEWMNLPGKNSDLVEFVLPDFQEAGRFHVSQLRTAVLKADGKDPWSRFQHRNLPLWANADGLLFNTIEEFDNIGLSYFRRKLGRPVWAIGPILLSFNGRAHASRSLTDKSISRGSFIEWLDTKPPNSVLYIAFGSQNTISATQMRQLAKALDAGATNFIWVVRPPLGYDINAEFKAEEWLPEGFVDRVKDQKKGLVVEKWAPQVEILSHKSIGAFMTHCGWNSVLESLSHGVPLIGWPMAAEQYFNAKFLEEMVGVCVEVARGTSFEVRSEDILEKIEIVMNENGKGEEMRRKSCEIEGVIRNATRDEEGVKGSSVKALEEFLDAALLMMKEKKRG